MTSIDSTESLTAPKLQIWNNDAFDDAIEATWSNLPPDFVNQSFDSDRSKENQIPLSVSSSLKSSVSFNTDPIRSGNLHEKPPSSKSKTVKIKSGSDRDIDAEIGEVEKEIGRLSTRLESLRLEKAEQTARSIAIRGRIVPAKFMESQKQQTVKFDDSSSFAGSKSRTATNRRGVSLGPGEIFSASKRSETATTPLQSAQNRRKSCFFKLPDIEEGKTTKLRGRSLSPRSRKAASKHTAAQKQAATTVGSKRPVRKEESVLSSIQPKKLFKEEEKRKPLKPGRVVASRYSLVSKAQTAEKDARKRSLPENEGKENHHQRSEKRRASDENSSKSEGRMKKRWEIPSQVDVYCCNGVNDDDETPIGKELPKIRTLRRVGDSPRDSGAAKRVAELEGKDRPSFEFRQLLKFEE